MVAQKLSGLKLEGEELLGMVSGGLRHEIVTNRPRTPERVEMREFVEWLIEHPACVVRELYRGEYVSRYQAVLMSHPFWIEIREYGYWNFEYVPYLEHELNEVCYRLVSRPVEEDTRFMDLVLAEFRGVEHIVCPGIKVMVLPKHPMLADNLTNPIGKTADLQNVLYLSCEGISLLDQLIKILSDLREAAGNKLSHSGPTQLRTVFLFF